MKKLRFLNLLAVIVLFGAAESSLAQSKADSGFKFSLSGHQMVGYHGGGDNAIPFSLSTFVGERLGDFGDAGIFLQYIFPKDQFENGYMAGVVVAPYVFNLDWGRLLWKNRIGYGRYGDTGGINLSTGFQLEPGSFIHFRIDVLARFITQEESSNAELPTSIMLGIGFNM